MIQKYGNTEYKRLKYIDGIEAEKVNDATTPVGFINAKGLLMEFAMKRYKEGMVDHYAKGTAVRTTPSNMPVYYFDDRWQGMKKVEYEGKTFFVGFRDGINRYYEIYEEAPRVIGDDTFHWKTNVKYGTRETLITDKFMEYLVIVAKDGTATVDIRYTACNNRHRNKVTMATIEIYDASNEEIIEAIQTWKDEFKQAI